jgi:hypothetical protein
VDDTTAAELLFRAIRDTLLERGADITSHPFDMLKTPDQALWVAAWNRFKIDLSQHITPPSAPKRRWYQSK